MVNQSLDYDIRRFYFLYNEVTGDSEGFEVHKAVSACDLLCMICYLLPGLNNKLS